MKTLTMWLVWNVPMGRLAPWVLGYALGSHPKRVMPNTQGEPQRAGRQP